MDFYCFHKWLQNFKKYHKYLYIVLMTCVVILTVAIDALTSIGPAFLAVLVNPWLGLIVIITLPLGILFINFISDLFDM